MPGVSRKNHWDFVYRTRPLDTMGWYQPVPGPSLELKSELDLPFHSPVIDIGGGDSYFSDHLFKEGFTDLTVLDISREALDRARRRHGSNADKIRWVESDVLEFIPDREYALWHDRATFHFLTQEPHIGRYLEIAGKAIRPGGYLILGTFSDQGPSTCSGLPVRRYSISELGEALSPRFEMIRGIELDHHTPSGGVQNYTFGTFRKTGKNRQGDF